MWVAPIPLSLVTISQEVRPYLTATFPTGFTCTTWMRRTQVLTRRERASTRPRSSVGWSTSTSTESSTETWNQRTCCWMMQVNSLLVRHILLHCDSAGLLISKGKQRQSSSSRFEQSQNGALENIFRRPARAPRPERQDLCVCVWLFSVPCFFRHRTRPPVGSGSGGRTSTRQRQNLRICWNPRWAENSRISGSKPFQEHILEFKLYTLETMRLQVSWLQNFWRRRSTTTRWTTSPWGLLSMRWSQPKAPFECEERRYRHTSLTHGRPSYDDKVVFVWLNAGREHRGRSQDH